jgi:hypothetical protein
MNKESLKEFMLSMSDSISEEKKQLFLRVIENSGIDNFNNPEEFYFAIIYPFENFTSGYLKSIFKSNEDVEFIFKNYCFIERHFCKIFEKFEGAAYCADKSRTIVGRILKFYETGQKIEFDYDSDYTYHLPKTIFKEHEHIILFYEGLKDLLYGSSDKYLEARFSRMF